MKQKEAITFLFVAHVAITSALSVPGCFDFGECKHGQDISNAQTMGEMGCLKFCQMTSGCKIFTYYPDNRLCIAFSECEVISTDDCPDCLTGNSNCTYEIPTCWKRGICRGTFIDEINVKSFEDCHVKCLSNDQCKWFTFEDYTEACFLHQDCPTLDETCTTCLTSSSSCKGTTSFTKLMVATGCDGSGKVSKVEIVDLEISSSSCQNLAEYPLKLQEGSGRLLADGSPLICGGYNAVEFNDCFYLGNNEWKVFPSLSEAKSVMKAIISPFVREDFYLVMVGGFKTGISGINTTEVLTNDGWKMDILPELPVPLYSHCALQLDSRTLMTIGPSRTFFMFDNLTWTEGPLLKVPRDFASCGRTISSFGSKELSVISAGGVFVRDVEVYDIGSSEWRSGPELPFALGRSEMVEDPLGGVILIGGHNSEEIHGTLLRLAHAGEGAEWKVLSQKLSLPRFWPVAYLIPDHFVNCTIN